MHEIAVIRSARRKKTVQARAIGGRIEIRIPAEMSQAEETDIVAKIQQKLMRNTKKSDADLLALALELNQSVLAGKANVSSIRWVANQELRWGSCTPATGDIRISDRLQKAPEYVLNSVIVHELVHTFIPSHSAEFWTWADKTPHAERAKGYLEAYQQWG